MNEIEKQIVMKCSRKSCWNRRKDGSCRIGKLTPAECEYCPESRIHDSRKKSK